MNITKKPTITEAQADRLIEFASAAKFYKGYYIMARSAWKWPSEKSHAARAVPVGVICAQIKPSYNGLNLIAPNDLPPRVKDFVNANFNNNVSKVLYISEKDYTYLLNLRGM